MVHGGAAEATGVDLDETAIEQAKRNANINNARIKWVHADAYSYARQMQKNGEQWDAVVLDPPKFVLSRDLRGRRRSARRPSPVRGHQPPRHRPSESPAASSSPARARVSSPSTSSRST
jgi:23S rRNA A1618 N6-methylase RlmF